VTTLRQFIGFVSYYHCLHQTLLVLQTHRLNFWRRMLVMNTDTNFEGLDAILSMRQVQVHEMDLNEMSTSLLALILKDVHLYTAQHKLKALIFGCDQTIYQKLTCDCHPTHSYSHLNLRMWWILHRDHCDAKGMIWQTKAYSPTSCSYYSRST